MVNNGCVMSSSKSMFIIIIINTCVLLAFKNIITFWQFKMFLKLQGHSCKLFMYSPMYTKSDASQQLCLVSTAW